MVAAAAVSSLQAVVVAAVSCTRPHSLLQVAVLCRSRLVREALPALTRGIDRPITTMATMAITPFSPLLPQSVAVAVAVAGRTRNMATPVPLVGLAVEVVAAGLDVTLRSARPMGTNEQVVPEPQVRVTAEAMRPT